MSADITIITVAYNSAAVLPRMLESVPDATPVIIVDNASTTPLDIQSGDGVQVIRSETNEGFGRACNRGAAQAQTEYLLFLNPDAALQPGALDAFLASAQAHPTASAFNPRFLDRNGEVRFRRRSKLDPQGDTYSGPIPDRDVEIPTLLGSAIFLRRTRFEEIGGFDPAIFLYHEDDDLALRLKALGPLMLCHDAVVLHLEGRGSVRNPQTAYLKAFHMARSRVYAYTKHGHKGALGQTLLRALFGLMSPLMLMARKRSKHIGFFKGAVSAMRDGGRYEG